MPRHSVFFVILLKKNRLQSSNCTKCYCNPQFLLKISFPTFSRIQFVFFLRSSSLFFLFSLGFKHMKIDEIPYYLIRILQNTLKNEIMISQNLKNIEIRIFKNIVLIFTGEKCLWGLKDIFNIKMLDRYLSIVNNKPFFTVLQETL